MGLPEEHTAYSSRGTFMHEVAKDCRTLGVKAATLIGRRANIGGFDFTLDAAMAEDVQGFIDYVAGVPGDDYNETRVRYVEYVKDGFGTMDAAKARMVRAHIIDLKGGEGIQIFAYENEQLMLYALAFWLTYGWLYAIEDFVLSIYQPAFQHIDSWVISLADLLKWAETVAKPTGILAMQPGAPFKAGDWCRFCKIRRTCSTRNQTVTQAMTGELANLDADVATKIRPVNTLTNEQIDAALRVKKMVTSWFSDLEHHARSEIAKGHDVGGWKMVEGRSNRAWKLGEDPTVEEIRKHLPEDMTPGDLYEEPVLLSPPKMEKLLGKELFTPPKEHKKTGEITPAGPLYHLIEKPRGAAVLAPPEDQRTPLTANALNELTVIPDPEIEL